MSTYRKCVVCKIPGRNSRQEFVDFRYHCRISFMGGSDIGVGRGEFVNDSSGFCIKSQY